MFLSFIYFIAFVIIVFYVPGRFVLNYFTKDKNFYILAPSLLLGILLYSVIILIFRYIGVSYQSCFIVYFTLSIVLLIKAGLNGYTCSFRRLELLTFFAIMAFVALLQNTLLFRSGNYTNGELNFYVGTHDPMHHLSLIAEIRHNFPFQNPSFAGEKLKNYHYFGDLVMAGILESLPIETYHLYFRIFPIFVSLLFSLSCLAVVSMFIKSFYFRMLAVIFMTSGGNFGYLIPLFRNIDNWSVNTFLIDQPFSQILSPQTYLGYSFFLVGTYVLILAQKSKNNIFLYVFSGVILAFSFPFKVYAAVIAMCGLFAIAVYSILLKRDYKPSIAVVSSIIILLIISATIINSYKNGLYFQPGWGLKVMVESADRLNLGILQLLLEKYRAAGDFFKLIQIYVVETFIFVVGNLSFRIIGILFLLKSLAPGRKIESINVYFFSCTFISLALPIIFNQGNSPYDIFQFGHYALIVTALFTVIALEKLSSKFKVFYAISLFILIFSLPTTLKSIYENVSNEPRTINSQLLESFKYIRMYVPTTSAMIVYPQEYLSRYTTGVGERRVYISDLGTINYAQGNKSLRVKNNSDFFNNYTNNERLVFLKTNEIDYVFTPINISSYENLLKNVRLHEEFVNSQYSLFRVIQ